MNDMEKQEFREAFAFKLTEIIGQSRYNRRELAEELGISYPALASYLSGTALPPLQTACKLAVLLNEDLDFLCGLKDYTDEETKYSTPVKSPAESIDDSQTYVQKQLRALYTAAEALGFDIIVNSNDGAVTLYSKNKFTNLFFAEMERGSDLDATLGIFQDLQIHNKELLDPISYKLAIRATNQKER